MNNLDVDENLHNNPEFHLRRLLILQLLSDITCVYEILSRLFLYRFTR
jgi:hypothetical protein